MSPRARSEQHRDKTLEDSFPASDPPANSGITGAEKTDKPAHKGDVEERPTGTPTSDRHAAETAHQREDEGTPRPRR
jgi:hypothetical protein